MLKLFTFLHYRNFMDCFFFFTVHWLWLKNTAIFKNVFCLAKKSKGWLSKSSEYCSWLDKSCMQNNKQHTSNPHLIFTVFSAWWSGRIHHAATKLTALDTVFWYSASQTVVLTRSSRRMLIRPCKWPLTFCIDQKFTFTRTLNEWNEIDYI